MVGLCLGGTLNATCSPTSPTAARTASTRRPCSTPWSTSSRPGVLGVFTDEATVRRIEADMATRGYLEARQMASTFDLLRANDLIWSYVARTG